MITRKRIRVSDVILTAFIYLAAALSVCLLIGIIVYVFIKGAGRVDLSFITSVTSVLKGTVGIASNILNTIYIILLTLLIATPLGIGAAIYLNEYARPGKIVKLIEATTETLSGIPSIIFGLFGMVVFGTVFGLSYSILTGSITMALMIMPLITRNTQEALKSVPQSYRQGALGIGATKWYMIRTILLPSAMTGILTGVILAVGRIVGESAALLFTAGSGYLLPRTAEGYFNKILEPGGTLTIQLYLSMQKGEYEVAFGIALVLIVIVLILNALAKAVAYKFTTKK